MTTTIELPTLNPARARRYASALTSSWRTGDMLVRHVADMWAAPDPIETDEWFRKASAIWNGPIGEFIEKTAQKGMRSPKGERRRIAAMPRVAREVWALYDQALSDLYGGPIGGKRLFQHAEVC